MSSTLVIRLTVEGATARADVNLEDARAALITALRQSGIFVPKASNVQIEAKLS